MKSGHFTIYQHLPNYSNHESNWINVNTDGWHVKMSGHWKNGKTIIPLFINKKLYLFMMADQRQYIETSNSISNKKLKSNFVKMFALVYY